MLIFLGLGNKMIQSFIEVYKSASLDIIKAFLVIFITKELRRRCFEQKKASSKDTISLNEKYSKIFLIPKTIILCCLLSLNLGITNC